ncbi:receptor-type tyrosine-protein phosphatase C isoform X3 [Siphateles boraxobius]|uniref:receptor-type tyrosine-protein phosphatase C isoform X3 n=1 Tax=Siphateles boraxobius TaxID=180520 RepID=UPI004062A8AF
MARYFALGPLVLVLCLALCSTDPPTNNKPTQPASGSPTGSTDPPTNNKPTQPASGSPTVTLTTSSNPPASTPKENNTGDKNQTSTSISLPPTTSQQQNITPTTVTTKIPCEYNVAQFGSKVHVSNVNVSDTQTYKIKIMNKNETVFEKDISSFIEIPSKSLKPCIEYTVKVDGCRLGNETIHFRVNESISHSALVGVKKVCFEDDEWNLSECLNLTDKNSCENTKITFNLGTCNYTLPVQMPPVNPEITFIKKIPTTFNWSNKPEKCQNSRLRVHCHLIPGNPSIYDLNASVFLEPSKMYYCTGNYTYKNTVIISNETQVSISCDLKNETEVLLQTNNTVKISWEFSLGDNCSGVQVHFKGSCGNEQLTTDNPSNPKIFETKKLLAFKEYECNIMAKTNIYTSDRKPLVYNISHHIKTLSHNPSFTQDDVKVIEKSHNSFTVDCKNRNRQWNGIDGNYTARIKPNGGTDKTIQDQGNCLFKFENLYYLTEYTFEITATNGNGNHSTVIIKRSTKYNDKGVIGFLTFLIIVTSLALLFVLYKIFLLKRKRDPENEEICLTQPLRPVEPIYANNLIEAYKTKIADESRLFMDEFQSIPRIFSNYTIREAKKQENHSKNRYVDILPYDYNRVPLLTGGERDYINASFIEGYREPKKYIAAQGPKDETIDDFWRMVWEQKSSIIVMVTRCEEGNKIKCAQYWPSLDRETEIFEDFVVKIRAEEHCPDYIIRYLVLANKREKAPEREVTHIQFISWPDHGVPGDPSLLLKLRRRVNSFKNFFSGPIVIHCSAGVGRTGTYIGIDAMIESLEAEGRVDIYGYVAKLRRQRCLMVQVEAQYILIHTGLIEYNQFGDTELSLSEFHSDLSTLRQKVGSEPSLLEMEFQRLPKFKNWRTFNTGSSEDNRKKNRYSSVIPYDFNRVLFRLDIEGNQTSDPEDEDEYSSDEEEESNEYINASFINGYWCNKSLIAAQGPLPNTAEEFLLMLYQQQTKTLVMLTDFQEDGKDFCSQYWGDEKKAFGEMEIEVKKTESFPTYVRRHLEIQSSKKKEILKLDQYQFLKWRSELPENAQELIEMMKNIRENGNYDNSKMNRNVPIVVHCNNGSSRTGIFCALWNLMDNALTEKLVDVFQEVKNLRKERQGMVETFEQYQFLYTAIEGAFPVQNGSVKTPTANDTAQIINETTALLVEPNCTTDAEQKEEGESKDPESKAPDSSEQQASESSTAAASPAEGDSEKTTTTESTTNGPAATVEV